MPMTTLSTRVKINRLQLTTLCHCAALSLYSVTRHFKFSSQHLLTPCVVIPRPSSLTLSTEQVAGDGTGWFRSGLVTGHATGAHRSHPTLNIPEAVLTPGHVSALTSPPSLILQSQGWRLDPEIPLEASLTRPSPGSLI